jgi:hypothetical protein
LNHRALFCGAHTQIEHRRNGLVLPQLGHWTHHAGIGERVQCEFASGNTALDRLQPRLAFLDRVRRAALKLVAGEKFVGAATLRMANETYLIDSIRLIRVSCSSRGRTASCLSIQSWIIATDWILYGTRHDSIAGTQDEYSIC